MSYWPLPPPRGEAGTLAAWSQGELEQVARQLNAREAVNLAPLGAEPERLRDGMLVYANGVDWNPGSGAGFYGREAGAWVKL